MSYKLIIFIIYLSFIFVLSIVSFMMFKVDKKRALNNLPRVKEKNLLLVSSLGGFLGAFIGRILCHHKSNKKYFSICIYFSFLINALFIILMCIYLG